MNKTLSELMLFHSSASKSFHPQSTAFIMHRRFLRYLKGVERRADKASVLLAEVMASHRDRSAAEYNGCDTDPCMFCLMSTKLIGTKFVPKKGGRK